MCVVRDPANLERRHPIIARDTTDVRPHPLLNIAMNKVLSRLCREDQMIKEI
jgi:hypothetical protein